MVPRAPLPPGAAIDDPQFVRLLYSQPRHFRKRRRIDRVWIVPDDSHESITCLDAAGSLISPRLQHARYVFAMGFPRPVTRIFVLPLETPAPCRVRLAATTLKPCENFAEYRIRLFLPYLLRSAPLLGATGQRARRIPKRFL